MTTKGSSNNSSPASEALEALMTIRNSDPPPTNNPCTMPTTSIDRKVTGETVPKQTGRKGRLIAPLKKLVPIAPTPMISLRVPGNPVPVPVQLKRTDIKVQPARPVPQLACNFPMTASISTRPSSYTCSMKQFITSTIKPGIAEGLLSGPRAKEAVPVPVTTPASAPKRVRTDEINRALQSAPQRGKKRGNLNQDERKELTKSRNRVHAKTTRERKKARYDELLQVERMYQSMLNEMALSEKRRKSVLELQPLFTELTNFQDSRSVIGDGQTDVLDETKHLKELFSFDAPICVSSPRNEKESFNFQGFEDYIRKIGIDFRDTVGEDACFDILLAESSDDIAISGSSTAFCAYEMIGRIKGSPKNDTSTCTISSGILQVRFDEDSKIASMMMNVASIWTHRVPGNHERVPSVVSLDKHRDEKVKEGH